MLKYFTSRLEDFICDTKGSMNIGHRLADVKLGAIQFESEKLNKLLLEQLHLIRVLKLVMVARKLFVAHDSFHEVFNEDAHLSVTSKLIVK